MQICWAQEREKQTKKALSETTSVGKRTVATIEQNPRKSYRLQKIGSTLSYDIEVDAEA